MAQKKTKTRAPKRANTRAKKAVTRKAPAKKARASAARTSASASIPSARLQFLTRFNHEHATTKRVIHAFPPDQHGFQPHPRSSSAKKLVWTFAVEQGLVSAGIDGTLTMPPSFPPEPATLTEAIAAYDAGVKNVAMKVAKMKDAHVHRTVPFFTGPGKMGDVPLIDVMWLMLMDSVHHRGQLSVYIRMAGGLVPSIYGPSADEPWM